MFSALTILFVGLFSMEDCSLLRTNFSRLVDVLSM